MLIANPISDIVFKWLMADERIARYFLETLLKETITEVVVKPQELSYFKSNDDESIRAALTVLRLDFVATIKTATGQYKKVLIEIQKARNTIDVMRFRNYLAEHYKKEDEIITESGKKTMVLPIITIYMLGFNLPEIKIPAMRANVTNVNNDTNEIIYESNEFVDKLVHNAIFIQMMRIEGNTNSRQNQLLSFFEQKHFIDDTKMYKDYPYNLENENMRLIANELHYAATNPERQKFLATEKEALRVYNLEMAAFLENQFQLEVKNKIIEERERVIEESKIALQEKDKAIQEKEDALKQALTELAELKKLKN